MADRQTDRQPAYLLLRLSATGGVTAGGTVCTGGGAMAASVQWLGCCGGRASLVCGNKLWHKGSYSETLCSFIVAILKATQMIRQVLVMFYPIHNAEFTSNY